MFKCDYLIYKNAIHSNYSSDKYLETLHKIFHMFINHLIITGLNLSYFYYKIENLVISNS